MKSIPNNCTECANYNDIQCILHGFYFRRYVARVTTCKDFKRTESPTARDECQEPVKEEY
jgi:hypothetical protein